MQEVTQKLLETSEASEKFGGIMFCAYREHAEAPKATPEVERPVCLCLCLSL